MHPDQTKGLGFYKKQINQKKIQVPPKLFSPNLCITLFLKDRQTNSKNPFLKVSNTPFSSSKCILPCHKLYILPYHHFLLHHHHVFYTKNLNWFFFLPVQCACLLLFFSLLILLLNSFV